MQLKMILKYFFHGVLFSLLFLFLGLAWFFVTALLVSFGGIIGLLIGIGLLFLVVGYVNTVLGVQIWNIEMKAGMTNMFFHGLALFVLLLIVNLTTSFLPNQLIPGIVTRSTTFVIGAFIDGFIGKKTASWFGYEHLETNKQE